MNQHYSKGAFEHLSWKGGGEVVVEGEWWKGGGGRVVVEGCWWKGDGGRVVVEGW